MSRFKDPTFIFQLGYVLAIYFAFIFVYLLFNRIFTIVFIEYLAIAILVSVTVLLFYKAYLRKQVFVFFIGFTIIGTMLFSLSTVATVPYTATESYNYIYYKNLYNNTLTLNPLESQNISLKYYSSDRISLLSNGTAVQLKFSHTADLRVKLYHRPTSISPAHLGLDYQFWGQDFGTEWHNIYWAPGYILEHNGQLWRDWDYYINVVLENRENETAQVILKVDYYDFMATSSHEVIKYRSAIDPYFGYIGVGLIIAAVIIEFWTWHKTNLTIDKKMTEPTQPQ